MELKAKVMGNIEEGRRVMGLDMIVRNPVDGKPATERDTPIVALYQMVSLPL